MAGRRKSKRPTLSVCMIAKDEEKMLGRCLESVKAIADEIVLVDTGSTDRTVEIAEAFGARVFHHPWQKNFSLHRNQSLSYATGDWILQIDADEQLEPEDARLVPRLLASADPAVNGLTVVIQDFRQNGRLHVAFNYPRLFRNRIGVRYESIVHNQVLIPGKVVVSRVRINHYGYDLDRKTMLRKFRRSVTLLRKMVRENPRDVAPLFYLTNAYSQYQRHKKCIEYAQKTITLLRQQKNPALLWVSVYYAYITSLINLKRIEEAESACREAIQVLPEYVDAYYHLSRVVYMQKKLAETVRYGREYLRLVEWYRADPARAANLSLYTLDRSYRMKYWLGIALIAEGEREEGLRFVDDALAGEFSEHVLALELVNNALATTDRGTAKEILRKVYARYAGEPEFVLKLARSLANIDLLGWLGELVSQKKPAVPEGQDLTLEALALFIAGEPYAAVSKLKSAAVESSESRRAVLMLNLLGATGTHIGSGTTMPNENLRATQDYLSALVETIDSFGAAALRSSDDSLIHAHILQKEMELLQHLRRLLHAGVAGDADEMVSAICEAAAALDLATPSSFDDVSQLLAILVELAKAADTRMMPDAGAFALGIAEQFFAGVPQIEALQLQRQISRSEREGIYSPSLRIFLKYLFPADAGKMKMGKSAGNKKELRSRHRRTVATRAE